MIIMVTILMIIIIIIIIIIILSIFLKVTSSWDTTEKRPIIKIFHSSPQSHRIEDQRSEPPPNAPTVPDEDFFGLILRLQSNRMDDQRSSGPGGRKPQIQPRR